MQCGDGSDMWIVRGGWGGGGWGWVCFFQAEDGIRDYDVTGVQACALPICREMVMLHAVPSDMAKNKNLVAVYQRYWNSYVSPGEAVFAHRGAGEQMVEEAVQNGMAPRGRIHEKEIFV